MCRDYIFKLTNGQVWQQENYSYFYHYSYNPRVIIYKNGNSHELQIEGLDNKIRVKR